MKSPAEEIAEFCKVWPNAEFGPAHIVVSDLNVEAGHLQWCSGIVYAVQAARRAGYAPYDPESSKRFYESHSDAELEATALLLNQLLTGAIQVSIRIRDGAVTTKSWRDVEVGQ